MPRNHAPAVLFSLGALLAGCANVSERMPSLSIGAENSAATASDLRAALAVWSASFASLVTAASDGIRSESRERDVRRSTLLWQLRMIPLARQAAFRPDAQEAYVASVAVATAQHEYLTKGEGSALFGAQQPLAADAAARLEQDVLDVGRVFLSDAQIERLQRQVDELVSSHPIRGVFAADALVQGFTDPKVRGTFTWVVDLPMVPFRALSGVSDTAQAVHAFNETAREFTETVNELPHLTRWELELLLYDAEELESVDRALAAAESFAAGAERISGAAETLPAELGAELAARLEQARATLVELDAALVRAEKLAGPLEHVADRVGDASAQWTALLTEMRADEGDEEGRPFDIREYESAASRVADASREIRTLVGELRGLDAGALSALLDAATWRAALLIVVFFAALALYRLTATRLR
jgi:HPt (histidine-containing phosphotransfer) domain-containing protein